MAAFSHHAPLLSAQLSSCFSLQVQVLDLGSDIKVWSGRIKPGQGHQVSDMVSGHGIFCQQAKRQVLSPVHSAHKGRRSRVQMFKLWMWIFWRSSSRSVTNSEAVTFSCRSESEPDRRTSCYVSASPRGPVQPNHQGEPSRPSIQKHECLLQQNRMT